MESGLTTIVPERLSLFMWLHVSFYSLGYTVLPTAPGNVSIECIYDKGAKISWQIVDGQGITKLEMTHQSVETKSKYKVITQLTATTRTFFIGKLFPATVYEVYIIAYNKDGMSNLSNIVTFKTLPEITPQHRSIQIRPAEVLVVVSVIAAWLAAVGLFLHKWGRIRILQPAEPRYKHSPKNLDTIQIVKRPTDSVIYKSYPKLISKTMQAREKRERTIARMNSVPELQVQKPSKKFKRIHTMPVIETEDITTPL